MSEPKRASEGEDSFVDKDFVDSARCLLVGCSVSFFVDNVEN